MKWIVLALAILAVVVLAWLVIWLIDARRADDEAQDSERFKPQ